MRFSVGVVGLKEHLAEIDALRAGTAGGRVPVGQRLQARAGLLHRRRWSTDLTRIDPLFPRQQPVATRAAANRAGPGERHLGGRRRHGPPLPLRPEPIGNIYDADFEPAAERPCPNETCGCHIGYVHLDRLGLYDRFGAGVLERVPFGYR